MSRTLTAAMAAHIAGRSHTRCKMLLINLRDGTTIGITDHDKDLDYDIGDGTVTYAAGTGILASNISLSCGLDADNYEVTGPILSDDEANSPYRKTDILNGRWNRARARLFEVNWRDLTAGAIKLLAGTVTEARVEGAKFILEIRSDVDRFNQSVGRVLANQCDADFADQIRCFAIPTEIVGTVSAVTDALRFTVTFAGAYADDFFNKGTVIGLTGDNVGSVVEIYDWTSAGAITLFAPLVSAPEIGDTFTVRDGCGKSREDCMAHDAIEWFRGFPEIPGSDQVLKPAIPPASSGGGGKGK